MESLGFVLAGALTLFFAGCVVLAARPVRSALALIACLLVVAVGFGLLNAPFVAAMQVLVYAGAIMVLFLFVIMMLQVGPDAISEGVRPGLGKLFGALAGIYVVAQLTLATLDVPGRLREVDGSVKHLGGLLLSRFFFAFESISLVLLAAVVASITLSLKRLP